MESFAAPESRAQRPRIVTVTISTAVPATIGIAVRIPVGIAVGIAVAVAVAIEAAPGGTTSERGR